MKELDVFEPLLQRLTKATERFTRDSKGGQVQQQLRAADGVGQIPTSDVTALLPSLQLTYFAVRAMLASTCTESKVEQHTPYFSVQSQDHTL